MRQRKPEALFTYGECANVRLTAAELKSLYERFGEAGARDWIETLSLQKKAHGYTYKSDFGAILSWARKEEKKKVIKEPVVAEFARPSQAVLDAQAREFKKFWAK